MVGGVAWDSALEKPLRVRCLEGEGGTLEAPLHASSGVRCVCVCVCDWDWVVRLRFTSRQGQPLPGRNGRQRPLRGWWWVTD